MPQSGVRLSYLPARLAFGQTRLSLRPSANTPANTPREDTVSNAVEMKPGHIYGEWQQPVNKWQGLPNSIHTDAVAEKVGMRGGTIPGSVHLGHFRAILDRLFADRWL